MSSTKIYYYKPHFAKYIDFNLSFRDNFAIDFMEKNYECVYTIEDLPDDNVNIMDYFEELFALFNSDNNPLCFINNRGFIHTSMSIGDVILHKDKFYIVDEFGFTEIKLRV